ncbi:histone-binding protein N1/N2-like isoform X2 [Mercenaria mercenaria]|uniref:histone-binding protein N1/N2-like isoform X2 n=1 Tax=Mercenaria mercenaria TaxID=6596 RepID=UPI00234E6963|nr:histone-binding protein N1/N2-like isoform X2 [Mercenaria mercenaria]
MASEGTSTSSDKERMEACESAVNILAQGKRNMVCGEIPTAVNQFQEACRILSKAYGETAKECADAYFCYGQALLDLARMENGVLGNALQGVPETDDESTEQKDEQFEKAEIDAPEREKLRKEVYDAMGEKEAEKKEREVKEAEKRQESGETMEVAMDTESQDKEKSKDEEKAEKVEDKTKDKTEPEEKDKSEKDEGKKKEKPDEKKSDKKDDISDKAEDKTENKSEEKTEDKPKTEEKKSEDVEMKEKSDEKKEEEEGSAEEEEGEGEDGEGTEEEGEGTEEEGDATAEEGEETTSQDGSQDGENPDDVSNLQLAWEMLELAKLIYIKDESKEAKLRAAESHLKLGEVSLETEQYEEAIKDLNKCLELQKELLDPDNRLLAETHYQLGLAYCFNKQFKESTDSYQAAIKVIEERVANLDKILDKATDEEKETKDFDSPIYKAKKEVTELKEILPDIKAKIEDVEDEKKNMEDLKNLAKEALGGLSSSSSAPVSESAPAAAPKDDVKASDISHLIKRKRKSEEAEDESVKKPKQEAGDGDAKVNGTSEKEAEAKPEAMETKS